MRHIIRKNVIVFATLLIIGCNSTGNINPVTKTSQIRSSVPDLTYYKQDKVQRVSAPDPISIGQMKSKGLYISDDEISAVGNNPFRFRNLFLNKALNLKTGIETNFHTDAGYRYLFKSTTTSQNNKIFNTSIYSIFLKFCEQNEGVVISEKTSNPLYREFNRFDIHHICQINNTYHSKVEIAYLEGDSTYFNFDSKSRDDNSTVNNQRIKESWWMDINAFRSVKKI